MHNTYKYNIELDKHCLELFPEMLEVYGIEALENASDIGRYIFFESFFNEFLEKNKRDLKVLKKAAMFIERLALSDDQDVINLTEIGILEGLVSRDVHAIAIYLGANSKKLLIDATCRTKIDRKLWQLTS